MGHPVLDIFPHVQADVVGVAVHVPGEPESVLLGAGSI